MFVRMRGSQSRSIAEAVGWRITGSADTFELSVIVRHRKRNSRRAIAGAEMP